jgi:uncharacterized protein YdhG (YjbR/CyaY superfamily)
MAKSKAKTIDEYIDNAPSHAQEKLREIRSILKSVVPHAEESIKWGTPVFEERRILFSFAAFKSRLNFMPTRSTVEVFADELTAYKTGRDTIQFPYDKPLPKALIRKIAKHRAADVRDNDAKWMHSD